MVGNKVVLTCFIMISMLFAQYGWCSIVKRRVTSGDNHITSQEISDLCCKANGARNCCSKLDGKAKNLADEMDTCKIKALAVNPCGSFEDRKYARDVHYCGVLLSINEKLEHDLKPRLKKYKTCVLNDLKNDPAGYDESTYTMPSQIITNLEIWHEEFIARHKNQDNCCTGIRVSQLETVTVTAETSPDCKSKFFAAVDEFIGLYEYVYFIEHLGRNKNKANKKPCPRGCGTRMEVFECGSSLLDYINITPPGPPTPPPEATVSSPVATVVISSTEETSTTASTGTESKVAYLPVSS